MNNTINKFFLSVSTFLFLTSCYSEKFDKEKWLSRDSALYDGQRKKMMNDLVQNVLRFEYGSQKGTIKKEVFNLIGIPDQIDRKNGEEIYFVEERIGVIDPNGHINLHFIYKSDSTLISWKIEDVDYKE
ncbi:hypothetical protein CLU96_3767 [Chryseobacterium sp. 52]|uniref:hypothetical protein n=1 Tax=Chryseobacterium sp. 52 TaxID=2035213 RepID=UPI000C18C771|nr:hypothetical protein [Chryseobacterium sp. 52]PIF46727.1 hypothetical protein CLU96_3767 [Chryseobacterium sp. 52]